MVASSKASSSARLPPVATTIRLWAIPSVPRPVARSISPRAHSPSQPRVCTMRRSSSTEGRAIRSVRTWWPIGRHGLRVLRHPASGLVQARTLTRPALMLSKITGWCVMVISTVTASWCRTRVACASPVILPSSTPIPALPAPILPTVSISPTVATGAGPHPRALRSWLAPRRVS